MACLLLHASSLEQHYGSLLLCCGGGDETAPHGAAVIRGRLQARALVRPAAGSRADTCKGGAAGGRHFRDGGRVTYSLSPCPHFCHRARMRACFAAAARVTCCLRRGVVLPCDGDVNWPFWRLILRHNCGGSCFYSPYGRRCAAWRCYRRLLAGCWRRHMREGRPAFARIPDGVGRKNVSRAAAFPPAAWDAQRLAGATTEAAWRDAAAAKRVGTTLARSLQMGGRLCRENRQAAALFYFHAPLHFFLPSSAVFRAVGAAGALKQHFCVDKTNAGAPFLWHPHTASAGACCARVASLGATCVPGALSFGCAVSAGDSYFFGVAFMPRRHGYLPRRVPCLLGC